MTSATAHLSRMNAPDAWLFEEGLGGVANSAGQDGFHMMKAADLVKRATLTALSYGDLQATLPEIGGLRSRLFSLNEVLFGYQDRIDRSLLDYLSQRLDVLFDEDEWDSRDSLPSMNSFIDMLRFVSAQSTELKRPSLFVNRRGLFNLVWRPERTNMVSIVFLGDERLSWVVFLPNSAQKTGYDDVSGVSTIEMVMNTLEKLGACNWMK